MAQLRVVDAIRHGCLSRPTLETGAHDMCGHRCPCTWRERRRRADASSDLTPAGQAHSASEASGLPNRATVRAEQELSRTTVAVARIVGGSVHHHGV